ncbi:MAG: LPXTG cell wall anchor domain-containing protein [Sphingobium sp.]
MRYISSLAHPAGTAIAAVLALAPLAASAQTTEADGSSQPQPVISAPTQPVAAPSTTAPVVAPTIAPTIGTAPVGSSSPATPQTTAQPVFAPSSAVVQPVPETAEPVAAKTAPVAKATTASATPQQAPAKNAQAAAASKTISASAASGIGEEPSSSDALAVDDAMTSTLSAPVAAQATTPDADTGEAALEDAATQTGEDGVAWVLGLGALALVAGAGVLAFGRRASSQQPVPAPIVDRDHEFVEPAAVASEGPAPISPVVSDDLAREDFMSDNEVRHRELAATSAAIPMVSRSQEYADAETRREMMIAEAPSEANPFLTRKNRLRRANFLMRQDNIASPQPALSEAAAPAAAHAARPEEATQVTYRFDGKRQRTPILKPRFN